MRFVYCLTALMLSEIVVTIFLTEESESLIPHKFLFRYFFELGIPLLILTLKADADTWKQKGVIFGTYLLVGTYLALYYALVGKTTRTSIMDSHVTLFMENVSRYILPGFSVCCAIIGMIVSTLVLFWMFRKKRMSTLLRGFWRIFIGFAVVFQLINLVQHPIYSNVIVQGKEREQDFITVAEYIGKKDSKIYYLNEQLDNNALMFGYLWQDYQWIMGLEEVGKADLENAIIITAQEIMGQKQKALERFDFQKRDLNLLMVMLWERDKEGL